MHPSPFVSLKTPIMFRAPIEEIAYRNGWILVGVLKESAELYEKSAYGAYLKRVAAGEIYYPVEED